MPFIAACQYCSTKVKVPDHAAGGSMECPRCHNSFTVVAEMKWPAAATTGPRQRKKAAAPKKEVRPRAPEVETRPVPDERAVETSTHVSIRTSLDTEALGTSASPDVDTPPTQPSIAEKAINLRLSPSPKRRRLSLPGVLGLFCGGIALVMASFPALRMVTLSLSGLGLLFGMIGLVLSLDGKPRSQLIPLVGSFVSFLVLFLVAFWPALFDPTTRAAQEPPPPADDKPLIIPLTGPGTIGKRQPSGGEATDWVDASRGAIQQADVRVHVTAVVIEGVAIKAQGKQRTTKEKYLVIRVRLSNSGAARLVNYGGWLVLEPNKEPIRPILTDHEGKVYQRKDFGSGVEVVEQAAAVALRPGRWVEDVLIFEAPPAKVEFLHLELPAGACGLSGKFQLAIPRSMIRR